MEYFAGSLITLITVVTVNLLIRSQINKNQEDLAIRYSQSHIYSITKPYMPNSSIKQIKESQAINYKQSQFLKVMVLGGKAYWIKDNALYVADVQDGQVDQETAKTVDTMAMSKVELDEVIFIVEQLREGGTR